MVLSCLTLHTSPSCLTFLPLLPASPSRLTFLPHLPASPSPPHLPVSPSCLTFTSSGLPARTTCLSLMTQIPYTPPPSPSSPPEYIPSPLTSPFPNLSFIHPPPSLLYFSLLLSSSFFSLMSLLSFSPFRFLIPNSIFHLSFIPFSSPTFLHYIISFRISSSPSAHAVPIFV